MDSGMLGIYHNKDGPLSLESNFISDPSTFDATGRMIAGEGMSVYSTRDDFDNEYVNAYSEWRSDITPLGDLNNDSLANERLLNFDMDLLGQNYPLETSNGSLYTPEAINAEIPGCDAEASASTNEVAFISEKMNQIIDRDMGENVDFLNSFAEEKLLECLSESHLMNTTIDDNSTNHNSQLDLVNISNAVENSLMDFNNKTKIDTADEKNFPSSSHKMSAATVIHKKYALNALKNPRKKKLTSMSLPQSPEHVSLEMETLDMPASLCFEDLNEVDFNQLVDNDINISPEKAFNRSFDIADVLNDMSKFDFMNKDIDTTGDLFTEDLKETNLQTDIDFDLPNFIKIEDTEIKMDDDFLLNCLNSDIDQKYSCNVLQNTTEESVNSRAPLINIEKKDGNISIAKKLPILKCENLITIKEEKMEIKSNKHHKLNNAKGQSLHFSITEATKIEKTSDTEDYIDVESLSDSEAIPAIAANSVNALFQQFEAVEELSQNLSSKKSLIKKSAKSNWMISSEIIAPSKSNCNLKTETRLIKNISHSNLQSEKLVLPKFKTSNIYLDHDYCYTSQSNVVDSNLNSIKSINESLPSHQLNNTHLINNGLGQNIPTLQLVETHCKNNSTSLLKDSSNNLEENKEKVPKYSQIVLHNNKLQYKSFAIKNCEKKSKKLAKDDQNIQNIIVMENGIEKVMNISNGDSNNLIRNNNAHKNSLLLCNFVKKSKLPPKNDSRNQNFKNHTKQSLLKPILKDNIKMVSLLKTNYANNNIIQKKPPDITIKKPDTISINNIEKTPEEKNKCNAVGKQKLIIVNKLDCKKRLNLSEYKKRRDGDSQSSNNSRTCSPINIAASEVRLIYPSPTHNNNLENMATKKCTETEYTKVSNASIENLSGQKKLFDPITEAAKKALRLKKIGIQNDKIDKIVMSKIPKVNNLLILPMVTENGKLLPMIKKIGEEENIVDQVQPREIKRKNSMYDEIEMVSIGVNTSDHNGDFACKILNENNNTLKFDKHDKHLIENNGLPDLSDCSLGNIKNSPEIEHGEDRIIMHKMKNSEKPNTLSIGTQTENTVICPPYESNHKSSIDRQNESNNHNYCQIDDCTKVNYNELINRWKTDPVKKDNQHISNELGDIAKTGDSIKGVASPVSSRSSRHRSRNAKYKYRRRDASTSSHSSNSYNKRPRSYSRDQLRNRSYDDSHRAVTSTNLVPPQKNGYFSDDRSVKSLPSKSKRKRNSSISSSELPLGANEENKFNRRRNKIYKEDDKSYGHQRSISVSSDSSVESISSSSSCLSSNSYNTSNSSSRSCHTRSSSKRSERSNKNKNEVSRIRRKHRDDSYEERKIVYVGMLEPDISVAELKVKFTKYGQVNEVKIHTKDDGMRYGFVTFAEARQTYTVLDKASSDADISHYDVFFGGRRTFCKQVYEDLDDLEAMQEESEYYPTIISRTLASTKPINSFDNLLQQAKAVLSSRKTTDRKFVYSGLTQ